MTLDDAGEFGQQALSTIICEGDAIGAVILYEKDEKSRMTETESKLRSQQLVSWENRWNNRSRWNDYGK